jgi:hypothetical protein
MLEELLKDLHTLKSEVDQINQLPEDQRAVALTILAEQVLNVLDNANIKVPEGNSIDGGIEIPTREI